MSFTGKNVLVTGADGFIGSHLAEALAGEGAAVTALAYCRTQRLLLVGTRTGSVQASWLRPPRGRRSYPPRGRRAIAARSRRELPGVIIRPPCVGGT